LGRGAGASKPARRYAEAVIRAALVAAVEEKRYFEKLEPYLLLQIATDAGAGRRAAEQAADGVGRVEAAVDAMPGAISDQVAAAVVREIEARGYLRRRPEHVLKAETAFKLAKRMQSSANDLDALVNDLIRQLDAAEEIIAEGAQPGNFDAFVAAVRANVAERTQVPGF
jgi:hypothetical protein